MAVLVWIVVGLSAGLLASRISHHTGNALSLDVALGVVGAIGGGVASNSLAFTHPTAFFVEGLVGAAAGSIAMLAGYRTIFRPA
jgi:uncharacterized membrane protein YeaQ/YmgE (transglycosylase-associated protein family)